MKLLKELIAITSLSGEEQAIQTYIAKYLTSLGLKPMWIEGNVAVHIPGKNSHAAMIFNAHVDTVPAGNSENWAHSPLKPWVEGDKVYGLGASDEKGGVAAVLLLAKKLTEVTPACDCWLTFVVKEEVDGSGTQQFLKWWGQQKHNYQTVSAVLVEPTGLEAIEIGHKGNVFVSISSKGDSGHGSKPERIHTNAVLTLAEALLTLPALAKQWAATYTDPILGVPTMAIGTSISGGSISAPNKFADLCTATVDVRTTPALHPNVIAEITAYLNQQNLSVQPLVSPAGWGLTEANDPLIQAAKQTLPQADVVISPGATDQCFFTAAAIPAIVLGPGEGSMMHKANEYCEWSKVTKAVSLYHQLLTTWNSLIE